MTTRNHVGELRTYADCEEAMGQYAQANSMRAAADRLEVLERIIDLGRKTCGQNNCNCPGATEMKEALK